MKAKVLLASESFKNITVNVYADTKASHYLKKDGNGNFYPSANNPKEIACSLSYSLYRSTKNENKRKKMVVEEFLYASSEREIKSAIKQVNASFEKMYKKVGGWKQDSGNSLFTMLSNKGFK